MKMALIALMSLFALNSYADDIPTHELRSLLRSCRGDENSRCLRSGLREILRRYEDTSNNARFTCRSNGNKFALYDEVASRFIDTHYVHTLDECQASANTTRRDLICAGDANKRFAIKSFQTNRFLDSHYNNDLADCVRRIRRISGDYICKAGTTSSNVLYARYNFVRNTFLDSHYNLPLDQCIRALP